MQDMTKLYAFVIQLGKFSQATQMNILVLFVVLVGTSASILPSTFDNDLEWKSVDLNQDGKPDAPQDLWIVAARSSDSQKQTIFGKSKFSSPLKADLSRIKWAHGVNSKNQLNKSLLGKEMMIELDVSMGTIVGGDGSILPIMAHPPLNISDLSLEEFIDTILSSGTSKGIKLDFKDLEALEPSLKIIKSRASKITAPLWLNADILPGPVNATTKPIDAGLFLNLTKTYFREAVLSVGWTTRFGPQLTFPLEIINEGSYTMDHMIEMRDALKAAEIRQPVTFPIRAGLSTSPESQKSILWLLEQIEDSSLTIWSSQYDIVDVPRLMELINRVGKENIYVDVPSGLNCEIQHFEE